MVFGDLEIIPEEGKVLLAGAEVVLTKTEFRLLCELANDPGGVFSRESLLDKVWGYDYFGDGRLVDVHIRRLRMKVETDPARRVLRREARKALLWEHVVAWTPPFLLAVERVADATAIRGLYP